MAKASHTKSLKTGSRKLTVDEIEDLWIVIEEGADSDDPNVLRAALEALHTLLADTRTS